jgi:hypothetical protein
MRYMVYVFLLFFFSTLGALIYYFFLKPKPSNNPVLQQIKANFAKIKPDYANIPLYEGDSAYTENKETITLCLVDPDTNVEYDFNTVMYVALHELAHMVSKSQGHGEEFRDNFAKLLRDAAIKGIYDPSQSIPTTYCKIRNGESIE